MKQWQILTDMTMDGDVIEEMTKKYKNSVLGIEYCNRRFYGKYDKYNNHVDMFEFTLNNEDKIQIARNTNTQIFIPNPEKGLYNTKDGVMYLFRNPLRQWKRGMCNQNVIINSINKLHSTLVHMLRSNVFDNYWNDVLEDSNISRTIPLEEAIKQTHEVGSVAINRTYGVMLHCEKPEGYILLHHLYHIGEVFPKDKTIVVRNNIFCQEIMDTHHEWAPNYRIIQ